MYIQVHSNDLQLLINLEQVMYIAPSGDGCVVYFEKRTVDVDEGYEEIRDLILKIRR